MGRAASECSGLWLARTRISISERGTARQTVCHAVKWNSVFWILGVGLCATLGATTAQADDGGVPIDAAGDRTTIERNLMMKTFGGRQFWGDVEYFHDWRIQHNVITDRYRLLDGDDYRHASGTLQECRHKLDEIRSTLKLPPMHGRAVILVHGIVRSSKSFSRMHRRLKEEGYQVFGFDYPSTRVEIPASAEYLHGCIESLKGIDEVNFVVHSMGGLLVRTYLAEHRDPRLGRMVMLGVPNLGAHMADRMKEVWLYQAVFGPAGQQLVRDPDGFIGSLPTPDFEFGIIAGSAGTGAGFNLLIPGEDDGTVALESTRLPGAADFVTVRGLHSFLMSQGSVIEYTIRFLNTGRFREDGPPQPIPTADAARRNQGAGEQVAE